MSQASRELEETFLRHTEDAVNAFINWCHSATLEGMMKLYKTKSESYTAEKLQIMQKQPHSWWASLDSHNRRRLAEILEESM